MPETQELAICCDWVGHGSGTEPEGPVPECVPMRPVSAGEAGRVSAVGVARAFAGVFAGGVQFHRGALGERPGAPRRRNVPRGCELFSGVARRRQRRRRSHSRLRTRCARVRRLPSLGFGGGPHICVGQHVARAEMFTAIDALLTRLPNLRLDPDAPAPEIIGLWERGPTEINVLWD